MNLRLIAALTALVLATPILAQPALPPPDPAFLQAALTALQTQRNAALDGQAAAEARITILNDQIAKLQARVTELQKLADAAKPKEDGK